MGGYLSVQLQAERANVLSGVCHQFQVFFMESRWLADDPSSAVMS